jgi:Uma2 family endonuclease
MASHPSPARWTYAEFARLPEDGNRYEVIAGELYVTASPRSRHQAIVTDLGNELWNHVRRHALGRVLVGPIDVLFAEGDYLAPDLVFVRAERSGIISDRGIEAAPDLVVEVLSPSTAARDRTLKRARYLHYGVPEYWVVDPDAREILVFRAEGDPELPRICKDVLRWRPWPGAAELDISVSGIFAGLDP